MSHMERRERFHEETHQWSYPSKKKEKSQKPNDLQADEFRLANCTNCLKKLQRGAEMALRWEKMQNKEQLSGTTGRSQMNELRETQPPFRGARMEQNEEAGRGTGPDDNKVSIGNNRPHEGKKEENEQRRSFQEDP